MRTFINALIGAVAAVILSFLPFSTLLGGAIAGFLEGPNERDGAAVGAISGLFMFVPIVFVGFLGLGVIGLGVGLSGAPAGGFAIGLLFLGFLVVAALVYTVGFAALGGYLGSYLAREYPDRRVAAHDAMGASVDDDSLEERADTYRVEEPSNRRR